MNANAKLWVEALRSGEYKQGTDALNKDGAFCCLGVACEVYQKHVGDLVVNPDGRCGVEYDEWYGIAPKKVRDWLRLADERGSYLGGGSLVTMNDIGATFAEIADLIESEPEGLFLE